MNSRHLSICLAALLAGCDSQPDQLTPAQQEQIQALQKENASLRRQIAAMQPHGIAYVSKEKYDSLKVDRDMLANMLTESSRETQRLQKQLAEASRAASQPTTSPAR